MQVFLSRNLVIIVVSSLAVACADRKDFQFFHRKEASQTGSYRPFSERPEAETGQFSTEEREQLIQELEADAQRLYSFDTSDSDLVSDFEEQEEAE